MQDVLNSVLSYLGANSGSIVGYGALGFSVSLLLQYVKKAFHLDQKTILKMDSSKFIVVLLTVFTGLATGYLWLLDPTNAQYVPENFAFILTAATYIHRFFISPVGSALGNAFKPYFEALQRVRDEELVAMTAAKAGALPVASVASPGLAPTLSSTPPVPDPMSLGPDAAQVPKPFSLDQDQTK